MICKLTGVVTALNDGGFTVRSDGATIDEQVATMLPGRSLRLSVGDYVEVYGGFDSKTGDFASAWASRRSSDGTLVPLRINPSDPPD